MSHIDILLRGQIGPLTLLVKDIFWTFTTGTVWNTTFKLLFLASASYTVYLMLNDYKPTHDPNIDTFKVQYLLAGSAVLGLLFPKRYEPVEVSDEAKSMLPKRFRANSENFV